ncbi:MAG: DNA polymerase I [Peptostreptococcaceae bacterium]
MNKTLVIIDGNSMINRAFFALPEMNNSEGLNTNAVYGFTTMLFKIIDTYNPTHISVTFDKKAKTFRHLEYEDYKAGRKKMSGDLAEQFKPLKDLLDSLKINRLEIEGFEADDIIGTVSKVAEENDFKVYIVTGDKDAIQLASHKTTTLITKKGISEIEEYDYDSVIEKIGMTPTEFIDLKGLMGDKSDNIPGIAGIGEVTGKKLIKEYGSVENIIENVENLKGSVKNKIIEGSEMGLLSKKLATIIRDVPIDFIMEDLEYGEYNVEDVIKVFEYLGFKTLLQRFIKDDFDLGEMNISELEDVDSFYKLALENKRVFLKTISRKGNILDKNLLYLFLSVDGENIYYIKEGNLESIKHLLESNDIKKIGYELKEDYIAFRPYGIILENIDFDIKVCEYLIDSKTSTSYEISDISSKYLYRNIASKEDLLGKGAKAKTFSDIDLSEIKKYTASIINSVYNIHKKMEVLVEELEINELFYNIEMPLVEVLGDMEYVGINIDKNKLDELKEEYSSIILNLENEIYELAQEKFNINSPKQLGVILFEKLGLPPVKKTKTGYSTNAEVLEKLKDKHSIIEKIIEYRQIVKLNSTYVEGLLAIINEKDGRIHSSFNQTITTTGRISSTEPNLQNIPVKLEMGKNIRKVFISNENSSLVDADYSQVELRVLAHMSEDETMICAFKNNEDIHTKTASQVFDVSMSEVTSKQRSEAKAVNFGIVYGKSDFGLSDDLNISIETAKNYIDAYFEKYNKIKDFMDDVIEFAQKNNYVQTILNRRRYIPEINNKNFMLRNAGKRAAMNAPIQGSAADIIKIAMVNVYKRLKDEKLESKLILQVHDELIVEAIDLEVEKVREIVIFEMENAVNLKVNLDVDLNIGKSWYETK